MIGTIARIKSENGFGFIKPNEGGDDIFFHARQVEDNMFDDLKEGETVSFEVVAGRDGRSAAENVVRIAAVASTAAAANDDVYGEEDKMAA